MAKRIKKSETTVQIPVVTVPEFIAQNIVARRAIEFQYVDRQGVFSRRVAVPICFVGVNVKMASLMKDTETMQGASRTFAVARISDPKLYVPTEQEKPVALLGWARVKGLFAALDNAKQVSAEAAEKRIARTVARENQLAVEMQAAFEYNRTLRSAIEREIRQ